MGDGDGLGDGDGDGEADTGANVGGAALTVMAWPAAGTSEAQAATIVVVAAAQSTRGHTRVAVILLMARILSDARRCALPPSAVRG